MLDLVELCLEAERLAAAVRNARCCDALRPCRRCTTMRRQVVARRLVIASPCGIRAPHRRTSAPADTVVTVVDVGSAAPTPKALEPAPVRLELAERLAS